MKLGSLVKYKNLKGWYTDPKAIGVIVEITKYSVVIQWIAQNGQTSYSKKGIEDMLEVTNAKEIAG